MKVPKCLADISPQWYRLLNKVSDLSEARGEGRLDIGSYYSCIVGEAYKFNTSKIWPDKVVHAYNCTTCETIADRFDSCMRNDANDDESKKYYIEVFNGLVEEFCQHMKSQHGEMIVRSKK